MSEILEIIMLLCFGASWPINLIKCIRAKSTKGVSVIFLILIDIGYVAGIVSKFTNTSYMNEINRKWYVLFFYVLNLSMVTADILVYFKNRRIMRAEGK